MATKPVQNVQHRLVVNKAQQKKQKIKSGVYEQHLAKLCEFKKFVPPFRSDIRLNLADGTPQLPMINSEGEWRKAPAYHLGLFNLSREEIFRSVNTIGPKLVNEIRQLFSKQMRRNDEFQRMLLISTQPYFLRQILSFLRMGAQLACACRGHSNETKQPPNQTLLYTKFSNNRSHMDYRWANAFTLTQQHFEEISTTLWGGNIEPPTEFLQRRVQFKNH